MNQIFFFNKYFYFKLREILCFTCFTLSYTVEGSVKSMTTPVAFDYQNGV